MRSFAEQGNQLPSVAFEETLAQADTSHVPGFRPMIMILENSDMMMMIHLGMRMIPR